MVGREGRGMELEVRRERVEGREELKGRLTSYTGNTRDGARGAGAQRS